jgi:hypothetical protein
MGPRVGLDALGKTHTSCPLVFQPVAKSLYLLNYAGSKGGKKVKVSSNRPWRPIGFRDVEDPTLPRQSGHRRRQVCQPYAPDALYSPERIFFCFWYSFLLEAE